MAALESKRPTEGASGDAARTGGYVRQNTLPAAERDLGAKRAASRLTADMGEHDLDALETFATRLAAVASNVVRRILYLEAKRHTATFLASAKRVLGVDLSERAVSSGSVIAAAKEARFVVRTATEDAGRVLVRATRRYRVTR